MKPKKEKLADVEIIPLTPANWTDFEQLFGEKGACGGCWCMWWKLRRSVFVRQKGEKNRQAMKQLVDCGQVPGLLAFTGRKPVGWCAVAPRSEFPVLERSKILKRIDDQPVWSVVCFFIARDFRNLGISEQLLHAAIAYARQHGGKILEGYPVDPKKTPAPAVFLWTGLAAAFRNAGFVEAARRSPTRPIMRCHL